MLIDIFLDFNKNNYIKSNLKPKEKEILFHKTKNKVKDKKINIENNYWGYINIPKLNIYYGFYSVEDSKNMIKNGIEVMPGSTIPSIDGSNIVLVAHSGIGYNILFDRLDILTVGDEVNLYFKNQKYKYKVVKKLKKDKNEILSTIKSKKNTLTLITCDKKEKNQNIIVYLELF